MSYDYDSIQVAMRQYVRRVYKGKLMSPPVPAGGGVWHVAIQDGDGRLRIVKVKHSELHRLTSNDPPKTRDYEYVVYAAPRVSGEGIRVKGSLVRGLPEAKRVAKRVGSPAGIYSITKGRFVGYIHPNGRYVSFR